MARPTRTSKRFKTRLTATFPVTAFAAVTLTLVVLFMMLTPLSQRYARVELPTVASAGVAPMISSRILSIDKDGGVSLDGRRVSTPDLELALRGLSKQVPQPVLMVRADRALTYRTVKGVLDRLRAAGIQDIRIDVAPLK